MSDLAIKVDQVSKTFRIPHEKISSLKGAFVNAYKKKGYDEFHALENVSFEIKKGEFFGIIGRNGSGKSTLLKILAGIYLPDKGKVKIDGRISPFLELGIGFNPELSGRDNIFLNGAVLGMTKKEIETKFDDIVAFSELERFIDQKLKNYSSGMQVRLAFSVAIHANKDILLMDEVLAVGDLNFQAKCLDEFNKYRDQGKTVILVTHDIATVQKYCDRAILLRNGKQVTIGPAEEVGKEYVYQNMVDEEKRRKENKPTDLDKEERQEKRPGNGDITIKKVELLSPSGEVKTVFNPFDDMTIRSHFVVKKDIKKAVFGIQIHNQTGYRLFGFNTSLLKTAISIKNNPGWVDFKLKNLPFTTGKYFITAGSSSENCTIQYDYWEKATDFTIMNDENSTFVFGDVNIKLSVDE